jgi:hypothetical protein
MADMHERRWFDDEDEEDFEPTPRGHLHSMQGIPQDAREMGLDRNVPEGAWLSFAGQLSASKPSHRLVAWLLLFVIVVSFLLTLRAELF